MGADLLLGYLWTTKPESIDFDKAEAAIKALTYDDIPDPECYDISDLAFRDEDDAEQRWEAAVVKAAREYAHTVVPHIKSIWNDNAIRDADKVQMGPVTAIITGGMSWGDVPSETWTVIQQVPWDVWDAIGFGQ